MIINTSPSRVAKFERVIAQDVTPFISSSATCVFARYVADRDPYSTAFLCRETGEWGLGGGLCSRLEVPDVWVSVDTSSRLLELLALVESECRQFSIALVKPIGRTNAVDYGQDLHFVASALPRTLDSTTYEVDTLSEHDFHTGRMHIEVSELLGSLPGLIRDFGDLSKFFVCRVENLVVAVADTIVSNGVHTAIQQVFTADEYRHKGVASALVTQVVSRISGSGGIAVYVCAADNIASINTANRAGFTLEARLINMKVDS